MRVNARLIVVLLLFVQAWFGFTRGQSLCIELAPCAAHAAERTCSNHGHGAVPTKDHRHDDCACHVHVEAIDEAQAPIPTPTAAPAPAESDLVCWADVTLHARKTCVRATAPPPRPPANLLLLRSTRLVV